MAKCLLVEITETYYVNWGICSFGFSKKKNEIVSNFVQEGLELVKSRFNNSNNNQKSHRFVFKVHKIPLRFDSVHALDSAHYPLGEYIIMYIFTFCSASLELQIDSNNGHCKITK